MHFTTEGMPLTKNEEGIVQMSLGGTLEIHKDENVYYNELGLTIYGTDDHQTITFIPWSNVVFVRTFTKTAKRKAADHYAQQAYDTEQEKVREARDKEIAELGEAIYKELSKGEAEDTD